MKLKNKSYKIIIAIIAGLFISFAHVFAESDCAADKYNSWLGSWENNDGRRFEIDRLNTGTKEDCNAILFIDVDTYSEYSNSPITYAFKLNGETQEVGQDFIKARQNSGLSPLHEVKYSVTEFSEDFMKLNIEAGLMLPNSQDKWTPGKSIVGLQAYIFAENEWPAHKAKMLTMYIDKYSVQLESVNFTFLPRFAEQYFAEGINFVLNLITRSNILKFDSPDLELKRVN